MKLNTEIQRTFRVAALAWVLCLPFAFLPVSAQAVTPMSNNPHNPPANTSANIPANAVANTPAAACPSLLDVRMPRLQDEAPQHLCQYAGKVILVVNTASYCGFTSQYKALETLYATYKDRGLVVLGFPANDFGQQEPGSNQDIAAFCQNTYGVKFPMLAKSGVTGAQANPLYKELAKRTGKTPSWNFYKYLINRKGDVVDTFSSMTSPTSKGLIQAVETALAAQP
jgi:glutathione peroxidase